MASPRTKRILAFWLSVLGHAVIVAALTFSVSIQAPMQPAGVVVPIETVMVDQAVLDARAARIEAERQAEIRRQQDEARRVEREQQRIAQEQRDREAAQQEKIRLEAEARAQEEATRQAEEAERLRQQELAREEAERQRIAAENARRQAQVQDEIAAAAAAEMREREAANSGARSQWAALISNKVQRNWQRPLNATAGLECLLIVNQFVTGEIRAVTVSDCNVNDENIIRSLENAVWASSPLPARPPGVAFENTVRITFRPTD